MLYRRSRWARWVVRVCLIGEREWSWYCRHCEEYLQRGKDAIACEDRTECIRVGEWGGDACGYIVCQYCRRPASEVVVS